MNLLSMQQTPPSSPACECGDLRERIVDLENKLENLELIVAGLIPPSSKKGFWRSLFRSFSPQ